MAIGWISIPRCREALTLEDITVVAYGIAPGTVGAYYPEANVLVPLNYLDEESGTLRISRFRSPDAALERSVHWPAGAIAQSGVAPPCARSTSVSSLEFIASETNILVTCAARGERRGSNGKENGY